ncbi:MAG: response regulator [Bacteroides sp.]|nr:response regulator [Bacteroides sp.]MCM1550630.1 response regulator [Clostridium sp.]
MKKFILKISAFILCLMMGITLFTMPVSAVAAAESKPYHFVFICPNKAHEYWTPIIDGMHKADEEQGTITEVIGADSYNNWEENLIANMNDVLQREEKPDGIIVRGGVSGMDELIDEAVSMGIPVFTIDADEPNSRRTAFFGSDCATIGKKAAQAVVMQVPEGSELGMVMSTEDSADAGFDIRHAFESIVNDYDMEVVDTTYLVTNDLADTEQNARQQETDTVAAIKEMLERNPNIKALFTTGAVNAGYAAKAKEELERDELVIVGQEDITENIEYVKTGSIYAVTAQRTDIMGYLSVINFKNYFDTGSLPQTVYDMGITLVTLDNVDAYKDLDSVLNTTTTTVRVGYYDDNEPAFQSGFSDDVRKSGYAYDYYQMLAPFAGWKYEYVYGSKEEIRQMLIAGDIDIMAGAYKTTSELADKVNFSTMDMGLEDNRYFAVRKSGTELLTELNYAMTQIDTVFPMFTLELFQKYYSESSLQSLTEREEQWLIEKNTLTFGYTRHHLPFSDQDEDGNPIGLVGEIIRSLEEFTGVEVVPVCFEYVEDLENALKDNTIDIGFPMYSDLWLAENKGLIQTKLVVGDRMMIIYHGEYTDNITESIAVSKTSLGLLEYVPNNYPNSTIIEYENFDAAVDAVYNDEAKCIIGYSSILQRILSGYENADKLNISYLDKTEELCLLVNQDNSILAVILDKMINQMDSEVITGTLMQYASMEQPEPTFMDFFKQYAYLIAIVFIIFFTVLAMMFVFYIRKSHAYNRQQAEMQQSLKNALELADAANKAKTNFLSSMSHDIRTPMNAIVGMTDIAKKHTDDEEKLNDCLDKITLSSQHLLTLINDVLDISKIESGKLTLAPINFSLRKVVENLVNIVRPMIKSKAQEFDVHIHGIDCEILYGDELRISQVFINILSNAVKYTPEGGKIILDLYEERTDNQRVQLTYMVRDNGIGMSRDYMGHMFDAFTRADDSRTNKVQGTGLGLAIVKQMVMLMNGTINCESEPDKGTTFTVKLELPIGEDDSRVYTLPPIDILLVDDDEIFLAITEDVVEEMGAKAETAHCGEKALELVKKRHEADNDYAVAMVDWRMPEMDGAQTVRAMRNIVGENTSIILVTAYDWSDIAEEAESSGADGFLCKPLFKSYLSEKIGRVLKKEKGSNSIVEPQNEDLKGLHILIAEDNDINWEVASEVLGMYGINTEHAENGKKAVEMMENAADGKYDLILMDIQMPIMNGREATMEIRKSSRDYVKNIPIIAMTADAFAEDIAACLAAGMDGHVAKPIDTDKLCQEIRRVING